MLIMTEQISDQKLKLREETLKILLHNFPDTLNMKSIYECADEWCRKQVTTNGLINYYRTYYDKV